MGEYWFWKLRQIAHKMRPIRRLRFESLEDRRVLAPVADIIDISPDPRSTPVGNVAINFSEEVSGVDSADFSLTRNGQFVDISALPVSGSSASYSINLSSVTDFSGIYVFKLVAANSGITNSNNELLTDDASDTWQTDTTAPTADIVDVTPDPRGTAVGDVAITFTQPVTGVDTADFHLTRNGVNVALAGLTVTAVVPFMLWPT
jgi:hypothetical protein